MKEDEVDHNVPSLLTRGKVVSLIVSRLFFCSLALPPVSHKEIL
jgi:hypothetical protein